MSRLRPICRFVSPLADSRSTSRILRTDNLSAAIPSPGSKSAGKDGLRGEGVQRRRRQPAWSTSTETAGQLAPKRVVRFDRNGWSAWSETSGQIGAKYARGLLLRHGSSRSEVYQPWPFTQLFGQSPRWIQESHAAVLPLVARYASHRLRTTKPLA